MKKIICATLLSTSILSTQALAEDSELYFGVDVSSNSNTFTIEEESSGDSVDADNDSTSFKFKFGTVSNNNLRLQGYYQYEQYDEALYDDTNDVLNEIGLDIIKGFDVTPKFAPFIQAGLGYGWMNVKSASGSDTANDVSLKIGGGLMYKVTPTFEGIVGVDLQYRAWSSYKYEGYTLLISEGSTRLYLGANIHF